MTDYRSFLLRFHNNLQILREREAKYAGNVPPELLNQIEDYNTAICLTEQVIDGKLTEAEWREALKPVLVFLPDARSDTSPVRLSPAEAQERRDLGILLNRVKFFWVDGVLEKSVHNQLLLELGKEVDVLTVDHPWERVLELPDQPQQNLPSTKSINIIFDEMNQAMVILGQPGSGKTVTLLELARDLIWRVEADDTFTEPIPVVFNLSSWTKGQPLIDWLVTELMTKYQIPERLGRHWLEKNRLLPLLDGLDELRAEYRAGCVEAINAYGDKFGLTGLVVCSRLKEYVDLPVRLNLNGAIRLQPLTPEQVDQYLARTGSRLDALRTMLRQDKPLRTLAQSPLMLNIMIMAYQDEKVLAGQIDDTVEVRRKHLFDTYVERMFRRKGEQKKPFTDKPTKYWLSWLAQRMSQHDQSIFLIEQMQPSWLSTARQFRGYLLGSRLIEGLILNLSFGLFSAFIIGTGYVLIEGSRRPWPNTLIIFLVVTLIWGLSLGFSGLVGGFYVGLIDKYRVERNRNNADFPGRWRSITDALIIGVGNGIIVGLILGAVVGAVVGINKGQISGLNVGSVIGLFLGIISGTSFGLIFGLRDIGRSLKNDIQTVENLRWSFGKAWRGCKSSLVGGLMFAIICACGSWLLYGGFLMPTLGLVFGSLLVLLPVLLFSGLSNRLIDTNTSPNQGIRLSLRNGVVSGITVAILTWLTLTIISGLVVYVLPTLGEVFFWMGVFRLLNEPDLIPAILILIILLGLLFGGIAASRYGVLDVIQHYTLRFIFWRNGYTPRNYIRFLDYASERIFLRKVGGGYIFIHRLLQEHFAAMSETREELR